MPYLTTRKKPKATTKPWFSRLLWHPARKRSRSILGHKHPGPTRGFLQCMFTKFSEITHTTLHVIFCWRWCLLTGMLNVNNDQKFRTCFKMPSTQSKVHYWEPKTTDATETQRNKHKKHALPVVKRNIKLQNPGLVGLYNIQPRNSRSILTTQRMARGHR